MNSLNSTTSSVSAKALLIAAVLSLSGCAASNTGNTEVTTSSSATADSQQMADEGFTENSVVVSSSTELCKCDSDSSSESSNTQSATTYNRDTEWFGLTQPFQEAEPAMGMTQESQLDSAAVNNGQPIPGLRVKQFSRRTLPSELAVAAADPQLYNSAPQFLQSRKSLSDYVAQLAFKLAGNQQLQGAKVGVASFVLFDSQLEHTSTIGNQLAEELSTVLPGYGAAVIEYKLTKNITVGPTGDLSLSRTISKLRSPQGIDYVLIGTMTPTRRGLQITSRVVSTRNNVVISSASTLIPALVLQQL
ncbi:FlgO family outer membrane protein [Rheinheimera soli]|uniref:FlgO family outer membrane protein n=1 Tax=Rheinheimera soli TaxID=443616 RepID=UPI001E2A80CD|nr:FlgO family outer membrane protein [Rheinheimera soli]